MNAEERNVLQSFLRELGGVRLERKDMEADAMIRQAALSQPDALYLLAQRALLQDQALQGMQQQVADLQEQVRQLQQGRNESSSGSGGFLDAASQWGKSGTALAGSSAAPAARPVQSTEYAPPVANAPRAGLFGAGGGSFLGSMAGVLAGAAAGHFLYQGMEHMMHRNDQQAGSQHLGDMQQGQGGLAADNPLARDAGVNDVGHASHRELAQFEDADSRQDVWQDSSADGGDFVDGDDYA